MKFWVNRGSTEPFEPTLNPPLMFGSFIHISVIVVLSTSCIHDEKFRGSFLYSEAIVVRDLIVASASHLWHNMSSASGWPFRKAILNLFVLFYPMGTDCAPLLADLFLYSYEA